MLARATQNAPPGLTPSRELRDRWLGVSLRTLFPRRQTTYAACPAQKFGNPSPTKNLMGGADKDSTRWMYRLPNNVKTANELGVPPTRLARAADGR
jgi:hypothetical protein